MLDQRKHIFPQFAGHNALTVAMILEMAGYDKSGFEFQRLHGTSESLFKQVTEAGEKIACHVYSHVGGIVICWFIWCVVCLKIVRTRLSCPLSVMKMCRCYTTQAPRSLCIYGMRPGVKPDFSVHCNTAENFGFCERFACHTLSMVSNFYFAIMHRFLLTKYAT